MKIELEEITPDRDFIFDLQNVPNDPILRQFPSADADQAFDAFKQTAEVKVVSKRLTLAEFAEIFEGDGQNSPESPIRKVYEESEALYVFALTLGEGISNQIEKFIDSGDYPAGYTLDCIASVAVEYAANHLELDFLAEFEPGNPRRLYAQTYLPGNCGWDVTGRRAIFKTLEPGSVGMSLEESCRVSPLKSAVGAIVVARPEVHLFEADFNFCGGCLTQCCQQRNAILRREIAKGAHVSGAEST